MIRRLIVLIGLGIAGVVVANSIPDIARYLKIREM
jgi:hypothetical protein